jgi:hypothetical protein
MLCFLQLGLAALGVHLMRKPTLRVGNQVAYSPFPLLIGLVLVAQLGICLLYGFKVGYEEAQKAAQQGRKDVDMVSIQSKHIWVDLSVPIAALSLCGLLLYMGLRDPIRDEYPGVPEWKKKLLKKMREDAEKDPDEYIREEEPVLPALPPLSARRAPDEPPPLRARRVQDEDEDNEPLDLAVYTPPPESTPIRRRRWRWREGK